MIPGLATINSGIVTFRYSSSAEDANLYVDMGLVADASPDILRVDILIESNVVLSSSHWGIPALTLGDGFPFGTRFRLINYGSILGAGGPGGLSEAGSASNQVGGGGGGGAGTVPGAGAAGYEAVDIDDPTYGFSWGAVGTATTGGAGGAAGAAPTARDQVNGSNGINGGPAFRCPGTEVGEMLIYNAGNIEAGGGGGGGGGYDGAGGAGGNVGVAGSAGFNGSTQGGSGGAAGFAVFGLHTIVSNPGTIAGQLT